jgi:hypothetical protein
MPLGLRKLFGNVLKDFFMKSVRVPSHIFTVLRTDVLSAVLGKAVVQILFRQKHLLTRLFMSKNLCKVGRLDFAPCQSWNSSIRLFNGHLVCIACRTLAYLEVETCIGFTEITVGHLIQYSILPKILITHAS